MSKLVWAASIAGALVAGWHYRHDVPFLRQLHGEAATQKARLERELPSLPSLPHGAGAEPRHPGTAPPDNGRPRRCLVKGQVLYTNDPCPSGSQEQTLGGGAVSVVPGFKAPPPPPGEGKSDRTIPHARDLLAPKDGKDLKEMHMERATGG